MKKSVMSLIRGVVLFLGVALSGMSMVSAADLISEAGKKLSLTPTMIKSIEQARQEQRDALKKENGELEKIFKERGKKLTADGEDAKNKLAEVKQRVTQSPTSTFLLKKQELLSKKTGMVSDVQRAHDGVLRAIGAHIVLLDQYLAESTQKQGQKMNAQFGSFEGLEDLEQKVEDEHTRTEQLKKKKEALAKELKSIKQVAESKEQEYAQKVQEQEALRKGESKSVPGLTAQQYSELLSLALDGAALAKELAVAQLQEKQQEVALAENEFFIAKIRLDDLEAALRTVKPSIVVTAEQIENAKEEVEKKQQEFLTTKARYSEELERVKKLRTEKEARLKTLSARYGISVDVELYEWRFEPKSTYESYVGLCATGLLGAQVQLLDAQEKRIERSIDLEREKVEYFQELVDIKETYYKLAMRRFGSREAIAEASKKYIEKKTALEAMLKTHQTKKDEADATVIRLQNQVLERIKKRRDDVQAQKDTFFKQHAKEFLTCLAQLDRAREYTVSRSELLESIVKSYTESIGILQKSIGHLRFILAELETSTIWARPPYAVSWAGIKNSAVDIDLFAADVRLYFAQFSLPAVWSSIKAGLRYIDLFEFILGLGFLLLVLIVSRFSLPVLTRWLFIVGKKHTGWSTFFLFWAMFFSFVVHYFARIAVWVFLLFVFALYPIADPYLYIIFYLLSIPYLLYLSNRLIAHMKAFNVKYDYVFVGADFQKRVLALASVLLYASVFIAFFRQAFVLAKYPKSELPDILLAINFIIFQLSLIFLISKEQVLSVIPPRPEGWLWVKEQVNRFYYLILACVVTVIVMSNPYVGYGKLVLHVISQLVYTAVLIRILFWAHSLIKGAASHIFFSQEEDEAARERFLYAKSWFGLIIIFSFIVLGIGGLLLAAQIWGWPITVADIRFWLTEPIIARGTTTPISADAIMQVVFFVFGGFLVAIGFNRFVLQKVFDLVPVDSGLQHAISSVLRYIIIALAIFLGFQSVGLVGMITYLYAVLLVGIGYMAKDSAVDFIAYFIILIQRPVKVGDYVKIDEHTVGVVRKITPKSVIIVRRNSTPIIVPNSYILGKPIFNWNYARDFTAFDDISVSISYSEKDPAKIRKILEGVVAGHPLVLKSPKPVVRLDGFGDYGYQFVLRGYVSSVHTLALLEIASDVRIALVNKLQQEGIELASVVVSIVGQSDSKKMD
ncbi:hypothetical protein CVU75_01685 [Candidatus Dependentiae bacterium HGW-Dependentiae-1]|nr:MAG: hypothetical protein CVU75_01685 [Candidatus Dependentiae bacterium HGW-Dependentiae-1]